MKKLFLLLMFLGCTVFVQAQMEIVKDVQPPKKDSFVMTGWLTAFNNDAEWIIWGEEKPVLENRMVSLKFFSNNDYVVIHDGSLFLCENSIIIKCCKDHVFNRNQVVYFYSMVRSSKNEEPRCIEEKKVSFNLYKNNASYTYSNDSNLINWLKEKLKNNKNSNEFVKVVINKNNGFGYYYPMLEFYLDPYQESELTDRNKILFTRSEDNYDIETEGLESYPTPINSKKSIQEYINDELSKDPANSNIYQNLKMDVSFIIERDGSVSNLIIDGGECKVSWSSDRINAEIDKNLKGFNNWVAEKINGMNFNPGIKDGAPVRTYCQIEVNCQNTNIIKLFNDVCIAKKGNLYGIVQHNKLLAEFEYDKIEYVSYDVFLVVKNGKYGFIQFIDDGYHEYLRNKYVVLPTEYDEITEAFSHFFLLKKNGKNGIAGWASCYYNDGHHGFAPKILIPCEYDEIVVKPNHIFVKKDEKWGAYYDGYSEKKLVPCLFDGIEEVNESYLLVQINNNWGLLKKDFGEYGNLIPCKYNEIIGEKDYFLLRKNNSWGLYNKRSEKLLLPCEYDSIEILPPYYALKKGNKWGLVVQDELKDAINSIDYVYDNVGESSEGLVAVQKDGKWGFWGKKYDGKKNMYIPKLIIKTKYDKVDAFSEGRAHVWKDNKDFYINKEGKRIKYYFDKTGKKIKL